MEGLWIASGMDANGWLANRERAARRHLAQFSERAPSWLRPGLAYLGGGALCLRLLGPGNGPGVLAAVRLPDRALGPLAVAVPSLFAAHIFVVRRCGTMQQLEEARRSPLVLSLTAFGLGVMGATAGAIVGRSGGLRSILSGGRDHGHLAVGLFFGSLSVYHCAEYATVVRYNPSMVTIDSFLVNQRSYIVAMAFAVAEYFSEAYLLPGLKGWAPLRWLGLAGMLFGEFFRKGALIQAGHNFTHQISDTEKRDNHELVTSGVYAFSRHPGYFGWFWWSISTQVLLCNPVATAVFTYVSWRFFRDRIPYEEWHLCRYFPDYPAYRERVPTRIPFIP